MGEYIVAKLNDLAEHLCNKYTPKIEIQNKEHYKYLDNYLQNVGARSIIIEPEYISDDYLIDLQALFNRFVDIWRKCC